MKTVTLDLETTGLPPKGANYQNDYMQFPHILSFAWKINAQPTVEYIINNRGLIVPLEATKINGITQEMVDESKFDLFSVICQFIMDAHGAEISIGHHIYFDTSVLKANILRMMHLTKLVPQFYDEVSTIVRKERRIDTCRASMAIGKGKRLKLDELYFYLFGKMPGKSHAAGADVDTTYVCYLELVKRGLIKVIL